MKGFARTVAASAGCWMAITFAATAFACDEAAPTVINESVASGYVEGQITDLLGSPVFGVVVTASFYMPGTDSSHVDNACPGGRLLEENTVTDGTGSYRVKFMTLGADLPGCVSLHLSSGTPIEPKDTAGVPLRLTESNPETVRIDAVVERK